MLMMPPALATKSGAHRIPRAASRSARLSSASWLLAAPAITAQRSARDGLVVEHAAERARGEHVDVGEQRARRVGPVGAELAGERALGAVDVGDQQLGAGARRSRARAAADVAEADHGDGAVLEVGGAEHALAADADRRLDAERGPGAGVARAAAPAREAGDVAGALGDHGHVGAEVPTSSAVR